MASTLSIVIPVFNEKALLPRLLERVEQAALPDELHREIVLVDDGSTDGTAELLRQMQQDGSPHRIVLHRQNQGKGAALRTGFEHATGDYILIQDADLEYNPGDYPRLLAPILSGEADVVFGSRFIGDTHRVLYYWHYLGNKLLSTLSNMLTNLNLTDMECCYKVFRRSVIEQIDVTERAFGVEPELTAKVAHLGVRIYETPVYYAGRTYAEGKKINWKDGLSALRCILRYNLLPYARPRDRTGAAGAAGGQDASPSQTEGTDASR
jgi:glycosyltransferase involved in cell wall biosynthesis